MPRSSGNVRLFVGRIRDILRVTGLVSDVVPLGLECWERRHWWSPEGCAVHVTGLSSRYLMHLVSWSLLPDTTSAYLSFGVESRSVNFF